MIIKQAEGNNNQDLVWKFCVVEQNAQCWKKTKGTTNKGRKFNPKRINNWLREVMDRR